MYRLIFFSPFADELRKTCIDKISKQEETEKLFSRELVIAILEVKDWYGGRKARANIGE